MSTFPSRTGTRVAGFFTVFFLMLWGAHPARAAVDAQGARHGAAGSGGAGVTQAVVVGALAFVLMLGAAAAVLWFTAKSRHHHPL
jgi:hypothetical protein